MTDETTPGLRAPSSQPPTARPAGRYGEARPGSRRWLVAVGVALTVAALAWVVWAGLGAARADVRWDDVGYRVEDAAVVVTFEVVQDPAATAVCDVQALNAAYATVGLVKVEVPAEGQRVVRRSVRVPTQERAVSGLVRDCRAA